MQAAKSFNDNIASSIGQAVIDSMANALLGDNLKEQEQPKRKKSGFFGF